MKMLLAALKDRSGGKTNGCSGKGNPVFRPGETKVVVLAMLILGSMMFFGGIVIVIVL